MKTLHQIYIGIGSNINRSFHIKKAIQALKNHFGKLLISAVYESPAEGFEGKNFYNCVVMFQSNLLLTEIEKILKNIEDQSGRDRSQKKFSDRNLDLDLLLFDDEILHQQGINVPRDEITKYAFVLKPLCDIAPMLIHPLKKQTIANLWGQFPKPKTITKLKLDFSVQ